MPLILRTYHWRFALSCLFILLLLPGCGSDEQNTGQAKCPTGEHWNERTGMCERRAANPWDAAGGPRDSTSMQPDTSDASFPPAPDAGDHTGTDATPDGPDTQTPPDSGLPPINCQDPNNRTHPDCATIGCLDLTPGVPQAAGQRCSPVDANCIDGQLECTFWAHTPTQLYKVDPFRKTMTPVTSVPSLTDIDTHPDGTLYGITFTDLYKYLPDTNTWQRIGSMGISGSSPNGLAINNDGDAFLTSGNTVYNLDLATSRATPLANMGGGFSSSGDCVVNKDNSLFMSSSPVGIFGNSDVLVYIDPAGVGRAVGRSMGFTQVYGLTAAWGRMFGLTGRGELIEINQSTGEAALIHRFPNTVWHGAASTPYR